MNILDLSEQEIVRRNSLAQLREMGIDPYPADEFVVDAYSDDIREQFRDDAEPRPVRVAGRIMSRRIMGKASFMELQDSKGRIQVYISRDDLCPGENKDLYNVVFKKLLDMGDFVGITGYVFRTQTGEISVHAQSLKLLSKSLRPLPVVKVKDGVTYDAFDDPELRYRQRYVDLVVNDGVRDTFLKRAKVIKTMRQVLDDAGYTEVETPTLQIIAGGATARPFITHFNALNTQMYMRIATELYLKRLIVGGFEGVYEIGKNFRNEGMDRNHNPEFTCMELYVQYKDYNWMMSFTEKLLETICIAVNGKPETEIDGKTISFKAPYRRLPILDAIEEKTGYNLTGMDEAQMKFPSLEEQMTDDLSLWRWFSEVVHVRRAFPAIARGTTEAVDGVSDESVAAFIRRCADYEDVLVVMNLRDQPAEKNLSVVGDNLSLAAVLGTNEEQITYANGSLSLPAYSIAVLTFDAAE